MAVKTLCRVSKDQFRRGAKPLTVAVADQKLVAPPREFSTGSLGWYANGKAVIEIDGEPVSVVVGVTITIVGSKDVK